MGLQEGRRSGCVSIVSVSSKSSSSSQSKNGVSRQLGISTGTPRVLPQPDEDKVDCNQIEVAAVERGIEDTERDE